MINEICVSIDYVKELSLSLWRNDFFIELYSYLNIILRDYVVCSGRVELDFAAARHVVHLYNIFINMTLLLL